MSSTSINPHTRLLQEMLKNSHHKTIVALVKVIIFYQLSLIIKN